MNYNFKIDNVFSVQRCANLKSELCTPGNIHYVTRTALNNGVQGLCGNTDYINEGNCIIIGGESAVAFYQNEPFVTGNNITVLRNERMSELSGLYIVSVLNKFTPLYSYSKAWNTKRVKETVISLPVIESADPDHVYTPDDIDWTYMREHIRRLEEEHIRRLEEYLKAAGFESAILTPEEQEALRKFRTGGVIFRKYRSCDLFTIMKGKRLTKADMLPGEVNFIGSSSTNNGITAKIGNTSHIYGPHTFTVSYNGSVGETFYQDSPYWASDDVNVWEPKREMSREAMIFVMTAVKKCKKKYSYSAKWTLEKMKNEIISLPSTPSGEPDYDLMSAYIRALEKKTVQKLKENYLNEEKATRKIIENGN